MAAVKRLKDINISLQIKQILQERIVSGFYPAERKLPAVRALAQEFAISPVTVLKAFDLLEPEGFIRRTERHGVFPTIPGDTPASPFRIAFCFPPQKFLPDVIGVEEWSLASEFHRGLLAGAVEHNAEVSFLQFRPLEEEDLAQVRLKLLNFDLCIFVSGELSSLARALSSECCIWLLRHTRRVEYGLPMIDYDRKTAVAMLVDEMVKRGIKSAGFITNDDGRLDNLSRVNYFTECCAKAGITVAPQHCWLLNLSPEKVQEQLSLKFSTLTSVPEIFFCDHSSCMDEICLEGNRHGFMYGRDFTLTAICSGATMNNLPSSYWYVRIPRFEMGRNTVKLAVAARKSPGALPAVLPLYLPETVEDKRILL